MLVERCRNGEIFSGMSDSGFLEYLANFMNTSLERISNTYASCTRGGYAKRAQGLTAFIRRTQFDCDGSEWVNLNCMLKIATAWVCCISHTANFLPRLWLTDAHFAQSFPCALWDSSISTSIFSQISFLSGIPQEQAHQTPSVPWISPRRNPHRKLFLIRIRPRSVSASINTASPVSRRWIDSKPGSRAGCVLCGSIGKPVYLKQVMTLCRICYL